MNWEAIQAAAARDESRKLVVELVAENNRLRGDVRDLGEEIDRVVAENERLRAALVWASDQSKGDDALAAARGGDAA